MKSKGNFSKKNNYYECITKNVLIKFVLELPIKIR
jgi:hypothetical protein